MSSNQPPFARKSKHVRVKAIDKDKFKQDIYTTQHNMTLPSNPVEGFDLFNKSIIKILDSHAPLQEKTVSVRPKIPWHNNEIVEARRKKRRAEKKMAGH